MNWILTALAALGIALATPGAAAAAEIKVWTARALATVLAEVGAEFERTTGHTLTVSSDLPAAFLRRANAVIKVQGMEPAR